MQSAIDHLVVAGNRLDAATAHTETALGLASVPGGRHALMGTHNRLLSLGAGIYVEALAPDPAAPAPGRPRWFGLDRFAGNPDAQPRLAAWALRVDDLEEAIGGAPEGIGPPVEMQRGDLRWRITVPEDGNQPFAGLYPALISWDGPDPSASLPDTGGRLVALTLSHPDSGSLGWALSMLCDDDRVTVREGPPALVAHIVTEAGERTLT